MPETCTARHVRGTRVNNVCNEALSERGNKSMASPAREMVRETPTKKPWSPLWCFSTMSDFCLLALLSDIFTELKQKQPAASVTRAIVSFFFLFFFHQKPSGRDLQRREKPRLRSAGTFHAVLRTMQTMWPPITRSRRREPRVDDNATVVSIIAR